MPNILNESLTITAEIEVPKGGAEGMIVNEGAVETLGRGSRFATRRPRTF